MIGYIVGYFESWGNDRNPIVIGHYTDWDAALELAKRQQRLNITKHEGLRSIYIVELESNHEYPIDSATHDWIANYTHYTLRIVRGLLR